MENTKVNGTEVNVGEANAQETGKEKKERVPFGVKHPMLAKVGHGLWKAGKKIVIGGGKLALGGAAGYALIRTIHPKTYVSIDLNCVPQVDATEGIDFVPAPEQTPVD